MSRQQIEYLLQECLEGFDAGLTPEECLSAYPHARAELEPMFRQALSLRIAYACTPSEAFKQRARETMLFHAGREVVQALSSEPDADFVMDSRQRFLRAAGAQAQEALRDVPPPRLPFWVNARRRLLEAAAHPAPRPAHTNALTMRSALSAAVVVLALGVAALGFFVAGDPTGDQGTRSASANQIEYIEQRLDQIERGRAQGITPPTEVLVEISNLTSSVVAQVASGELEGPLAARVPALIQRQEPLVQAAVATSPQNQPELVQVAQQLAEAEIKLAAAAIETPAPTSTSAVVLAPSSTPSPQPTATVPAASPTATSEPSAPTKPVRPSDLDPGQLVIQIDVTDKEYATPANPLPWVRVTTSGMTFVIAQEWEILNIKADANGIAQIEGQRLTMETGNTIVTHLVLDLSTGEVSAAVEGKFVQLRSEDGDIIDAAKLLEMVDGNRIGPFLHHFVTSIEFAD